MYCPYCQTKINSDTTVCYNCGKSFSIASSENKCSNCGYSGSMIIKKKRLNIIDWIIIIAFFPISIIYGLWIKSYRPTIIEYKCPRCKHIETV
ncbi:MAG: zinc ribbon domain-containing protein [Oscillospiraceae bacterium]